MCIIICTLLILFRKCTIIVSQFGPPATQKCETYIIFGIELVNVSHFVRPATQKCETYCLLQICECIAFWMHIINLMHNMHTRREMHPQATTFLTPKTATVGAEPWEVSVRVSVHT